MSEANKTNGKHSERLEEIRDDVHFVKETMVPFSYAINSLSQSVEGLSKNVEVMSGQLENFLTYQATLSERYRRDVVKLAGILLFLVFALIFGAEGAAQLAKGVF